MDVKFITSNSSGDYYAAGGAMVKHRALPGKPLVCLGCKANACEHIEATEDFIASQKAVA